MRERHVLDTERNDGREHREEQHLPDNFRGERRNTREGFGRSAEDNSERAFRDELEHRQNERVAFLRELRDGDDVRCECNLSAKRHRLAETDGERLA